MNAIDPYHFHPELRGKIKPAADSFFRDMDLAAVDEQVAEAGFPSDWRTPCDDREADRREWLEGHRDQDLWIFAYGSLIWDPSVEFDEVRVARCEGFQRSFCLWDDGGRGSVDEPGLMLAIDEGGCCEGVAFRIPKEKIEQETFVLFRREMLMPVYRPAWLELQTGAGPVTGLAFVANRDHKDIRPGLPMDQKARMIAHASGFLGSNFDYLEELSERLVLLGINDPYVATLLDATKDERQSAWRPMKHVVTTA
ncbi:gamma-glutamylcyclotransferase [Yoonia sp.]|uniref:gamma-glutamylcyclotransferase n=1 Tax=Yoonia sp. TaxID=2212373 RepID=UPI002FD902F1